MFAKLLFGILFVLAVISLFIGLFFLLKKDNKSSDKRTLYALIARIGFSVIAVAIILIALLTGKLGMNKNPVEIDKLANEQKQRQQQNK